jgi:hypothetical protein
MEGVLYILTIFILYYILYTYKLMIINLIVYLVINLTIQSLYGND